LRVRIVRNEDVKFLATFIPLGHRHVRVIINLGDEILIFQQAFIDALIRAYASVALHPYKKCQALTLRKLSSKERKEGFAEYQLIELSIDEDRMLYSLTKLYNRAIGSTKVYK